MASTALVRQAWVLSPFPTPPFRADRTARLSVVASATGAIILPSTAVWRGTPPSPVHDDRNVRPARRHRALAGTWPKCFISQSVVTSRSSGVRPWLSLTRATPARRLRHLETGILSTRKAGVAAKIENVP